MVINRIENVRHAMVLLYTYKYVPLSCIGIPSLEGRYNASASYGIPRIASGFLVQVHAEAQLTVEQGPDASMVFFIRNPFF